MIVIKDDFYPNPDEIREAALKQFFITGKREKKALHPGMRTLSTFSRDNFVFCKNQWSKMLGRNIVYFPPKNSNTAFNLGLEGHGDTNWVHHDCSGYLEDTSKMMEGEAYAAVVYLTPDADCRFGTALFKSNISGKIQKDEQHNKGEFAFKQFWEAEKDFNLHTFVGNIYNRCILYPAKNWHAPFNAGFGHDKQTGRLVQLGFFTVQ